MTAVSDWLNADASLSPLSLRLSPAGSVGFGAKFVESRQPLTNLAPNSWNRSFATEENPVMPTADVNWLPFTPGEFWPLS
jgi:hypothetical protein